MLLDLAQYVLVSVIITGGGDISQSVAYFQDEESCKFGQSLIVKDLKPNSSIIYDVHDILKLKSYCVPTKHTK